MQAKTESVPIVLFGAGKVGRRALEFYGADHVIAFCDNNEKLWGTELFGKSVLSYQDLKKRMREEPLDIVLSVTRFDAVREIVAKLENDGLQYRYFSDDMGSNAKSNQDCFTDIYKNHKWGGDSDFYSGPGSHRESIIRPYIQLLVRLILNNELHRVVDFGCGDFHIMGQVLKVVREKGFACDYTGIDVVQDLISHHVEEFGDADTRFLCADASAPDTMLPDGDILIVREVLQHLTNADIAKILAKATKYHYILDTEGIYEGQGVRYNLDIKTGPYTRANKISGVYLEQPPYNKRNIVHLLRVPEDGAVIRTSLIIQ